LDQFLEKYGKKRLYAASVIILIIIAAIIALVIRTSNDKFDYKGHSLKMVSLTVDALTMEEASGAQLIMKPTLTEMTEQLTITYQDDVLIRLIDYEKRERTYTFSDGSTVTVPFVEDIEGGLDVLDSQLNEAQLIEKNEIMELDLYRLGYKPIFSFVFYTAIWLVFQLWGISMVFYPANFRQRKLKKAEENGDSLTWLLLANRIGGGIMAVFAYVGLIAGLAS